MLRSFIYLDEEMVDDYLAQVEGGIIDGTFRIKETSGGNRDASASIKASFLNIGGKVGSTNHAETEMQIHQTGPAKFTRLHKILELEEKDENDKGGIIYLNGFDEAIYSQIESGEIIEVKGKAQLADWAKIGRVMNELSDLRSNLQLLGQDFITNSQDEKKFEAFSQLTNSTSGNNLTLIVVPFGSPQYKFVAKLAPGKIKRREDLEQDVTVLGQVQRRLEKGETIDIFRLAPNVQNIQMLSRNQRRTMAKNSKSPIDETVKYPAIQILPIAIFQ